MQARRDFNRPIHCSMDPKLSYLYRLQTVVGGELSRLPIVSGMPQDSVLGPLLFLIFINEIANQVFIGSQISFFANDIALYRPILNDADYCTLQSDISAIVTDQQLHAFSATCKMLLYPLYQEKEFQTSSLHYS